MAGKDTCYFSASAGWVRVRVNLSSVLIASLCVLKMEISGLRTPVGISDHFSISAVLRTSLCFSSTTRHPMLTRYGGKQFGECGGEIVTKDDSNMGLKQEQSGCR